MRAGIRNSVVSIMAYVLLTVLSIGLRKLFLLRFDSIFLGYESLFISVFTLLSVAEMSANGVFTYRLYEALEKKKWSDISQLASLCKKFYRIVGIIIAVFGVAFVFFVPFFFNDAEMEKEIVYGVYAIQLLTTLSNYFFGYRRILFIADQKEYKIIRIDLICKLVGMVIQIIVIFTKNDYLMYFAVNFFVNVISNVAVIICGKHTYHLLRDRKVKLSKLSEYGLANDMKNIFAHKLSEVVYSSSDNVIISVVCGVPMVALLSNYMIINYGIMNAFVKILAPLEATFGHAIYREEYKKSVSYFRTYDMACYALAFCTLIFFPVFLRPTIVILFGEKYVMPNSVDIAISLNNYVSLRQYAIAAYRNAYGDFGVDRNSRIISAVINVVFSLALGYLFGVTGVLAATVLGHFTIWYGRIKAVSLLFFKNKKNTTVMLWKEVWRCGIALFGMILCLAITDRFMVDVFGILYRMVACIGVVCVMTIFGYLKCDEFKMLCSTVLEIINERRKRAL